MKEKKSFFKKLAKAVMPDSDDMIKEIEKGAIEEEKKWMEEGSNEGELTVDVFENANHIVIKTIVAGVKKEDLDISLSRDMVTIKGKRSEEDEKEENNYYHKELYWGSFSRTILLPEEVDIEKAEATENQGLLTIKLPKVDKERQTKIRVKSI